MLDKIKNIFKPKKIVLENGKEIQPPMPIAPFIIIGLVIALIRAGKVTGFEISMLLERGDQFFNILKDMFPPDFSYAKDVLPALIETIRISVLGSLIGSGIAIPFAMLCAVNINKSKLLLNIVRVIMSITRTLPTLIIALIATWILGLGAFAGTAAISIFTFGIVTKMLYEKIETVDMGPFEAMEAVGATRVKAFIGSVMPQIMPSYLSICLYSLEINVRAAAILGYVGAGGIGLILNEKIGWREYDKVGMVIFMLFITVLIIENGSKYIRERLG